MKEIHILFTGVGRRIELVQAFKRAAMVLGRELKIYGADMAGTAPALAYCDHTRKTVSMKDPGYIQDLIDICVKDKIDLVIPTIDTDLIVLSRNRERFEEAGTKVMISAPDKIMICRDKNNTSSFFTGIGLEAPAAAGDIDEYRGGFPAFIKPKDGSSSIDAYKADNMEDLKVYASRIGDYVIQPFIEGREYTIDIFCDWEGEPVSIVPRERLQVRAGEVLKTRITMDPVMIKESRKICSAFRPCGPITVQLIRDREGTDRFIEINPRYGGGAPLSMKAGARSAETVIRLLDGEKVCYNEKIADGAVYSRFDQSVCITEGVGQIKGVIFDLDDTLYSEKDYVRSGYKAVSDHLGGGYEEKLYSLFEEGKPAIDELLKSIGREDKKDEVLGIYRNHIPDISLYPEVQRLLETLRDRDIRTGIITDGRPEGQRNKIRTLGLEGMVDDIVITDELGGAQFRKPCDIAFRIMSTRWKMDPADIIYVGDNGAKDFQAPQQLGMRSVWFMNEDGIYNKAYDREIDRIRSLSELYERFGIKKQEN